MCQQSVSTGSGGRSKKQHSSVHCKQQCALYRVQLSLGLLQLKFKYEMKMQIKYRTVFGKFLHLYTQFRIIILTSA